MAVISVINSPLPELAIVQALVLFGALACSVYLFSARPDRYWYAGHAVAESIKTVTWRFHIPTDLVVAQEASDVESSSRLDFLLLHNLGDASSPDKISNNVNNINDLKFYH